MCEEADPAMAGDIVITAPNQPRPVKARSYGPEGLAEMGLGWREKEEKAFGSEDLELASRVRRVRSAKALEVTAEAERHRGFSGDLLERGQGGVRLELFGTPMGVITHIERTMASCPTCASLVIHFKRKGIRFREWFQAEVTDVHKEGQSVQGRRPLE